MISAMFFFQTWFPGIFFPAGAVDVRYAVPAGDSPSIGPANAPVTIVEFLDYQ